MKTRLRAEAAVTESTYQLFRGVLFVLDLIEVFADPLFWLATSLWVYWVLVF